MRVLIVGDVMLDRYWHGNADRVSPEAPVPVVHVRKIDDRAGGAANVACNVKALGATPVLIAAISRDEPGHKLRHLCRHMEAVLVQDEMPTTLKLRVVGRNQQLVRADFEEEPSDEAQEAMLDAYEEELPSAERIIFSDYGKGGLGHVQTMIDKALAYKREIYVDPKGSDWKRYRGVTLIKPNLYELRDAVGSWRTEEDMAGRVRDLLGLLSVQYILVTRASDGMTLFSRTSELHIPAVAREVYDVTGAGDTAIAALCATTGTIEERVRLANKAAGIVCGKFGTAVATAAEVFE